LTNALLVLGGLALLVIGAELLVRAGTRLAAWAGIRPIIIGLTVVSLGTSVPELAIGIDAALTGSPGLAIGNIVGTNLVNILLILGLSALLVPIAFERATLRIDLPAMTAAAFLLFLLALDGRLTSLDGGLLLLGGIAYTVGLARASRSDTADTAADQAGHLPVATAHRPVRHGLLLVAGLIVIVVGAELLVEGAVSSARALGVSDAVIGLTVVAVGTSAPELVTTVMSTMRGDRDIAIGNLIGSSTYNIGIVLGLTVLVAPGAVPVPEDLLAADLVLLTVVAVASVATFVSGSRIARLEGGLFVASYLGYLTWLLLTRT
jgi:cation:H+ antiporter